MRREIARFSLSLILALGMRAEAVPWREKGPVRFASSLPERLIDSIMAQGNWNLLFQEGPFGEFQRQIAIANYFALRGERQQAEIYFKKAETALAIAYGSLRGRYEWPRLPQNTTAKDLPWGENRDTFQDYVLCSLQLFLEAGLAHHESGEITLASPDATIAAAEKQLSVPLRQKDPDLHIFVSILQEAIKIRQSKSLNALEKADRFERLSISQPLSVRNYWVRRGVLFRLFENIYHGNLGRANALAEFLYEKQGNQLDSLVLARIFTSTTAYERALTVATAAQSTTNLRLPENYSSFIRHSLLVQNLYVWTGMPEKAEKLASETVHHLRKISTSSAIAGEDRLEIRKSFRDQQLRQKMFAFLHRKLCPAQAEPGETGDMDNEWLVKERLFLELCGLPRNQKWWQGLGAASGSNPELKAIAAFSQGTLSPKMAESAPELRYLLMFQDLRQATAANGTKQLKLKRITDFLAATVALHHDFLFLDWGINVHESSDSDLKRFLVTKADEKSAQAVFLGMHRRYAEKLARGKSLVLFSPPDAAVLLAHRSEALLNQTRQVSASTTNLKPGRRLRYTSADLDISYDTSAARIVTSSRDSVPADTQKAPETYFGSAAVAETTAIPGKNLAPLYFWCENCGDEPGRNARLLMASHASGDWRSTHIEIADNFSQAVLYSDTQSCDAASATMNDTLLVAGEALLPSLRTCALRVTNIVTEAHDTSFEQNSFLALTMGWRHNLAFIVLPREASRALKTSLLFDYFQKRNRREMPARVAFNESLQRAEKSFSAETAFRQIHFYAGAE